jgi:hypothetical protein
MLLDLKKPIDKGLISLLEDALTKAKSGEIVGVMMLVTHPGGELNQASAGDMEFGEVLAAFEDWRIDQGVMRHIERNQTPRPPLQFIEMGGSLPTSSAPLVLRKGRSLSTRFWTLAIR